MSQSSFLQASRAASRALRSSAISRTAVRPLPSLSHSVLRQAAPSARRCLSVSAPLRKGIMPDTESPAKQPPASPEPSYGTVDLSESDYHDIADEYLDGVLTRFEALQDTREDLDIEYASGVMTITHTDKGTYVINKQPPNKQIWLSSPLSGPKRYDWCVVGEGQADKEGSGQGSWIYARDGSSLNGLILEELGVDLESAAEN